MIVILRLAMMTMLFGSFIAISEDGSVMLHIPDAFQPTKGSVIGHIDIEDQMHYEMDIEIHSFTEDWINLIHVTATGDNCCNPGDRLPGIWLYSRYVTNGFYYEFSTDDGDGGGWTNVGVEVGKVYHLELDVTQSWMTVHQDGVTVHSAAKGNHQNYEDAVVYASSPFNSEADGVTISNLIISSFPSSALNAIEISNLEEEVADLELMVENLMNSGKHTAPACDINESDEDLSALWIAGGAASFAGWRNIDGTVNNFANHGMGAKNAETGRCMNAVYGDGYNSLAGPNRPNPRDISNELSDESSLSAGAVLNSRSLSQLSWQWGQFIDHDMTLIAEDDMCLDPDDHIDIEITCPDPFFECGDGEEMEMKRTHAVDGTGTATTNKRKQTNMITSWIDGSVIYGSDPSAASTLRAFQGGLMRISDGDLLPIDVDGTHMSGDVRVNEQPGLTVMHTIFVRFHNKIACQLASGQPAASDEDIYQQSKAIVTAVLQKITYEDWLPALFGDAVVGDVLGAYGGYDASESGDVCMIWASGAFRFGHTMLPSALPVRDSSCNPVDEWPNDLSLAESFFAPNLWTDNEDLMELLMDGFACTACNEVDLGVTDSVRNMLFQNLHDPLDLMALNINRGREHGLPDYNAVRAHLGLAPLTSFDDLSSDSALNAKFQDLYGNVDDIDLFTGMLAEDHQSGSSFGETTARIVLDQFRRTRDADRFWYENYISDAVVLAFVESMNLGKVITMTTGADLSGRNVFFTSVDVVSAGSSIQKVLFELSTSSEGGYVFELSSSTAWTLLAALGVVGGMVLAVILCRGISETRRYRAVDVFGSDTEPITDVEEAKLKGDEE